MGSLINATGRDRFAARREALELASGAPFPRHSAAARTSLLVAALRVLRDLAQIRIRVHAGLMTVRPYESNRVAADSFHRVETRIRDVHEAALTRVPLALGARTPTTQSAHRVLRRRA